mgnify:CR=1 FL=1
MVLKCGKILTINGGLVMMYVNIYKYFSQYTKEEVKLAINSLRTKYQNVLKKFYDINGNFLPNVLMTRTEHVILEYIIIVLLPKTLDLFKEVNMISVYELCSSCDKDTVNEVISLLSFQDRANVLKREKFIKDGDNDYSFQENVYFFQQILPFLKAKLQARNIKEKVKPIRRNRGKSLYDILEEYSRIEIEEVLKYLSTDERELLSLRYDDNFEYRSEALLLDESLKKRIDTLVQNKIKKSLKEKRIINMHNSNLYLVLGRYPKEAVRSAIRSLSSSERELLYSKYDSNLNVYLQFREASVWQKQRDYLIKVKIPRIIDNEAFSIDVLRDLDSIYENHSKDDIIDAIKKLPIKKRSLVVAYYNDLKLKNSFIAEENKKRLVEIIYDDLQRILGRFYVKDSDNLYIKLNAYSEDDINYIISLLSKEEQDLLKLRYDDELNLRKSSKCLDKGTTKIINKIVSKIIRNLKKKEGSLNDNDSLFGRFGDYTKEEVLLVIDNLSLEEKATLKKFYGKDFNKKIEVVTVTEHEMWQYRNLIHRKLPRYLSNKRKFLGNLNLTRVFRNYTKTLLKHSIECLSQDEKSLLALRYDDNYSFKMSFLYLDEETKDEVFKVIWKVRDNLEYLSNRSNFENDLFYKYSYYKKEDIFKAIKSLNAQELEWFFLRYDEKFMTREDFDLLDIKIKHQIYSFFCDTFKKRLERLKNNNEFQEERIKIVNYVLSNKYLKELNAVLDNNVVMILLMMSGYANGIKYSSTEISEYLNMDIDLVDGVINLYNASLGNKLSLKRS